MVDIRFVYHHEMSYVTGPVSGPVVPGDVRTVTEEEAQQLVDTGFWEVAPAEDQEAPKRGRGRKSDETKEVQRQDQQ